MTDCLIIECSARKRDPETFPHVVIPTDDGNVPAAAAWNVYDGTQMRMVRAHYPYRDLEILILSARFGLLTLQAVIPFTISE